MLFFLYIRYPVSIDMGQEGVLLNPHWSKTLRHCLIHVGGRDIFVAAFTRGTLRIESDKKIKKGVLITA